MKTKIFFKYNYFFVTLLFLFINIDIIISQDRSDETIFTLVENMPASKSCMHLTDEKEKRTCTSEAITKYIMDNINYPEDSKNANIEGVVYISYIVNKEGSIEEVEVLKGIDESLDKEAIRVVKSLPQFIPGTQREIKVNVRYNVPIKFSL